MFRVGMWVRVKRVGEYEVEGDIVKFRVEACGLYVIRVLWGMVFNYFVFL